MEPKFQTSFIPKQSLSQTSTKRRQVVRADILFIIAMVAFLLSLAMAGGVFVYGKFTQVNINRKTQLLEEAKASYNPELITELSRLSRKMNAAEGLLTEHVAASAIFKAVSENTLKSIKFDDFTYIYDTDKVTVSMRGEANGFSSIALQSDMFGKSKMIRNPIFSNLTLSEKGKVEFLFTAEIDPSTLLYKNNFTASN